MQAKVKQVLNQIVDQFKSGNIPQAVAYAMFPVADVPSARWSLLNRTFMFLAGTADGRGYKQWLSAGRHVKKGSKAFYILVPFFNILWMLITGIILHLCLILLGGAKNGFEGTFRVVAFSQSPQIMGIVPFIGGVIGFVWNIVLLVIGFKEAHETTYSRVIISLLIPVLFVILLIFAMFSTLSILVG